MDRTIRAGDGIVCRVNGTFEHYVVGTVVAGKAGGLSLRAVSTMVGQDSAVRHAYQQRAESRVPPPAPVAGVRHVLGRARGAGALSSEFEVVFKTKQL